MQEQVIAGLRGVCYLSARDAGVPSGLLIGNGCLAVVPHKH